MKLPKDSREFIALLNACGVRYVVVGGYAVVWHGHPRFTGDVDFFVERSEANAAALEQVITKFGFAGLGLTAKDFLEPETVVQLGRPPYRIDIINFADGIEFEAAWRSRVEAEWDGLPVHILSKELLLVNKRASGREQDLADYKNLTAE
jgi:hypothetical protein